MDFKTHSSIWGYNYLTPHTANKNSATASDDVDMNQHRIINLGQPRKRHHAATLEYVQKFDQGLDAIKLNKAGDTMTGNLDMDFNQIVNVSDPTNEADVATKQYVDLQIQNEHDTRPYALGRYIVIPGDDGIKRYFSVRAKKNINLDRDKVVEVKHDIRNSNENEFNSHPQDIVISKDIVLLPNPGKSLGVMRKQNDPFRINFEPPGFVPVPWTFLYCARPEQPPQIIHSVLTCYNPTNQSFKYISITWTADSFKYAITNNVMTKENAISHNLDTTKLNHITFECIENKFCVWINGIQKESYNIQLGDLTLITLREREIGIVSIYSKHLNKQEIVQHFVDNHVENFTNDEVLI